jgi:hypothetical protein
VQPEEESAGYYKVLNRQTIKRLDSGMEITRAKKHEPVDSTKLTNDELRRQTDKVSGSKFSPVWSLPEIVSWLETQIEERGWRFPPGVQGKYRVQMNGWVGYVDGKPVNTITIMVSGRWVHAYPDKDQA